MDKCIGVRMDVIVESNGDTRSGCDVECMDGNQLQINERADNPLNGHALDDSPEENIFEMSNGVSLEGRQLTAAMMYPEKTMVGEWPACFAEMVSKIDKLSSEVTELRLKVQMCKLNVKPQSEPSVAIFPRGRRQVGAFIGDEDVMNTMQQWLSTIVSARGVPSAHDETYTVADMLKGVHEAYRQCTKSTMGERDVLSRRTLLYLVNRVFNALLRSESRVYTTMQQLHATEDGDRIKMCCVCSLEGDVSVTVSHNDGAATQRWVSRDSQSVNGGCLRRWEPVCVDE